MNNGEIASAIKKFKGKLRADMAATCLSVVIEKQYFIGVLMEQPEAEEFEIEVKNFLGGSVMFINSIDY